MFFRRRRRNNNPILGGLIIIVMGLGLTTILSRTVLRDAEASESWPAAAGTIITSELQSRRNGDGYSYSARIIYQYSVDGEQFESGGVTVADGSSSRPNNAQNRVAKYPVGEQVEVFYNPEVPTQTVLETGAPQLLRWLNWAGIALIVLGGWVLVRSILRIGFTLLRLGLSG